MKRCEDACSPKARAKNNFPRSAFGVRAVFAPLWPRLLGLHRGARTVQAARLWQCEQNQALRPPMVADFNSRLQRGHLPPFPRCGNNHDLGMRSASAFASIAFSKM